MLILVEKKRLMIVSTSWGGTRLRYPGWIWSYVFSWSRRRPIASDFWIKAEAMINWSKRPFSPMKRWGINPTWLGEMREEKTGMRRWFRSRVKVFVSVLMRNIGRQFFRELRSPFFGKRVVLVESHEGGKIPLSRASLYTLIASFEMSGWLKKRDMIPYGRPSIPGLLLRGEREEPSIRSSIVKGARNDWDALEWIMLSSGMVSNRVDIFHSLMGSER